MLNNKNMKNKYLENEKNINSNLKTEDEVKNFLIKKFNSSEIKSGQTTTFQQLGFTKSDIKKIQRNILNEFKLNNCLKKRPDMWYLPDNLEDTAVIVEAKSPKKNINEQNIINQLWSYIYITSTRYKKIVGIISNGSSNIFYKYSKGAIEKLENIDNIEPLEFYEKIYSTKEVNKEAIYSSTYKINNIFYKHIKIKSLIQRMIFSAGMLIAKKNGANYSPEQSIDTWKHITQDKLSERIEEDIKKSNKQNLKVKTLHEFFVTIEPLIDEKLKNNKKELENIKKDLLDNLNSIVEQMDSPNWKGEDVMSIFFNEFSRYKGEIRNGQVFTPDHIASLMCKIAKVDPQSNVLDACCGSGTFLIKAMALMIEKAGGEITEKAIEIKNNHLFGIENDKEIYALACSNFLLHKDGKTNLQLEDATTDEMSNWISDNKINKVLMNPPYEDSLHCLEIILNVLNSVEKNADCLFLLPNNKLSKHFNKNEYWTNKILEKHRLLKIIKLPEIFKNLAGSGEVSIFCFKAHEPQKDSEAICYWIKEDGFENIKNKGRQDVKKIWSGDNGLEKKWIEIIDNNREDSEFGNTKNIIKPSKGELEYIKEIEFEINEDDFLKTVIDRCMFDNPEIAKLFNLKGKK